MTANYKTYGGMKLSFLNRNLIGHIVAIDPQTDRKELVVSFEKDLEQLKNGK